MVKLSFICLACKPRSKSVLTPEKVGTFPLTNLKNCLMSTTPRKGFIKSKNEVLEIVHLLLTDVAFGKS